MRSTTHSVIADATGKIAAHGLVVFAGAGVSADAPSRVPGWFDLNGMILNALKQRATNYLGRDPIWLDQVIQGMVLRRDTHRFPPEYQAQIMEEQCGLSYFRALAELDVAQRNKSHAAIARLARAGHVRAVVTTNFDCLIETALESEKVQYESFFDEEGFRRLSNSGPETPQAHWGVPVLKIHGSVKSASSMIDTLQQRLIGRSDLLANLIVAWLGSHVVLYAGFSASDLNHNPDYLGLRQSAAACPGALFVRYPGSRLEPGAESLLKAYGQKAHPIESKLNDLFSQILTALNLDLPSEPAIVDADPTGTMAARLKAWTESLDPYEAINVLSALFDASGEEEAAWTVLHKAWKSRLSADSKGVHYARYQYNYANHCLQSGEMQYEETPQNFIRSQDVVPQSRAGFALWSLYRARTDDFWPLLLELKARAPDPADPRLTGDLMIVLAQAAVIYRWTESLDDIIEAGNRQRQVGDIPRAIRLWAAAARLAAQSGDLGTVNGIFNHCEPWCDYLGDDTTLAELHLAYATASLQRGFSSTVEPNLAKAVPVLRQYQRWPLLIEALIEGYRALIADGRVAEGAQLVKEVNQRIAKGYEIYYPHLGIAVAEYHLGVEQWDRAKREILQVHPLAEQNNNHWAVAMTDAFLTRIDEATGGNKT